MATLLIDRKDVVLRQEGVRLLVYEGGERTGSVPVSQLERVVIQNRAVLDTGVLGVLAEQGVGLVVLNPRRPARTAHLAGRAHSDVRRRLAQYRCSQDEDWCLRWSRWLVIRKLRQQRRVLGAMLSQRADRRRALSGAMRGIEERLSRLRGATDADGDRIRGLEGAAAAAYFRGYVSVFPASLGFTGRNRRPPRDPVNACLSLGYTLLHAEAVMALHTVGLDPLLGFFHDPAFRRESLASDLIEPLRALVDEWVWHTFQGRELRAEHFFKDKGACLLNKSGRKVFYSGWECRASVPRRRLQRYARALVRALVKDERDA